MRIKAVTLANRIVYIVQFLIYGGDVIAVVVYSDGRIANIKAECLKVIDSAFLVKKEV